MRKNNYPIPDSCKWQADILCTVRSPTTQIYSKLNDILFSRRIETFSLLAGATVAIVLLIVFLSKWSSLLGREVQRRTM
ncbi:MAG: hypothetical protein ACJ71J_03485, partial [Nitrososphaeraceae archaeon]